MDYFSPYTNPNLHHYITNNKSNNPFHGGSEVNHNKKRNKRNNNNNNNKMTSSTKVKLSTDPQSVAARERRHRISEKFKILRSLIPGADTRNMDTVSMLEEAIQYVKYLKSQIWLHQTMISFDNFNHYNDHAASRSNNNDHQDSHPFDHSNYDHDYQHHGMLLPQVGFAEGSWFKVESDYQDNMVSLSDGHHHAINYP